ncbi:hypothetical protein WMY93_033181 [Mugilogobius chulae]|uniref:Uncharacterized protein n=1 Tax=Mugilogobius chulae TaxID=88201 RepID=A0AAW0MUK7_9GOBI
MTLHPVVDAVETTLIKTTPFRDYRVSRPKQDQDQQGAYCKLCLGQVTGLLRQVQQSVVVTKCSLGVQDKTESKTRLSPNVIECLIPKSEVQSFVERCMTAVGTKPHHAHSLAEVLVEGDHRGHYSHGLNRMGQYLQFCSDFSDKLLYVSQTYVN